jgi:TonB family protein
MRIIESFAPLLLQSWPVHSLVVQSSVAQSWILAYLVNALWQAPLVFAAAWLAARVARPAGPHWEHRIWVSALLAQLALPLGSIDGFRTTLSNLAAAAWALFTASSQAQGSTRVLLGPATTHATGLNLSSAQIKSIVLLYAASVLYAAIRILWGLRRTYRLSEDSVLASPVLQTRFATFCEPAPTWHAAVQISPRVSSPLTFGIARPLLLLPTGLAEQVADADLDIVLAHEAAHLRRRDFAKNLFYTLISLPLAFHPVTWATRSRIASTREMICDAHAAEATTGRENYVRSLLRLATLVTTTSANLHVIGIFDANAFEKRVLRMIQRTAQISRRRRILLALGCTALALATCTSALALRISIGEDNHAGKHLSVDVNKLTIVNRVPPVYPVEAKKMKIQGSVVLAVIIGASGEVENISVKSGPKELQQSALDAVRQWKWQPYLLNGDAVEVETQVTVVYQLAE